MLNKKAAYAENTAYLQNNSKMIKLAKISHMQYIVYNVC